MITLLLGKIAERCVFCLNYLSAICFEFSDDNTKKRRLAGAVNADKSRSFLLVYMKSGVF